jgi:hypothetical protein
MVAICSTLRAQVTGYTTGLTWEAGASSIRFQLSSFSSGNVAVLLQSKRGWLPGALRGGGDFGKSSNDWRIYWDLCGILFIDIYVIIHAYIYISVVLKNANPSLRSGDFSQFIRVEPKFWIGNPPIGSICMRQGLELF